MRTCAVAVATWLLCTLATFLSATDCLAAEWLNDEMTLKLSVDGTNLTGTFTRTSDGVQGTVAGAALEDGISVKLTFKWDDGEGGGEFGAILKPAGGKRLLTGTRWDASGVFTSIGFHRAGTWQPADLPDEDSDFTAAGVTPPDGGDVPTPVVTAPVTPDTPVAPDTPATPPGAEPVTIFDNANLGAVGNQPTTPTTFTTTGVYFLTYLFTYHWNGGRGAPAGEVTLRSEDGMVYGPWPTTTLDGSGARSIAWVSEPNCGIPPGTYTVVDSDPASWSQNGESGGAGITTIRGIPVGEATATPGTGTAPNPGPPTPTEPTGGLPKLKLTVCTTMQEDRPADPATRFRKPTSLHCWTEVENMPADTVVTCIWVRDGRSLNSSEQTISGSGSVRYGISTTAPEGFPEGKYSVKLRVGDTVIGYQDFVVE